ncbi:MAG: AAA family ATPase [Gammaproteobacteria bacterium]|nr:AAA family ATPase [Gammaproteobacteria bacterium]
MITISCYNIKGGVGKTTTAVNLAYLASLDGAKVLVWDLDPQGAASFYFRVKPKVKGGVRRLFQKKSVTDNYIKGTDYGNIDILPADFSYRNMDILLEGSKKPRSRLRKILKSLSDDYDYVILDCPPSFSMVSESIFYASDVLLIPTIPTPLSLRTFEQILKYGDKKILGNVKLLPFFSMVDRRKNMHRAMIENPPKKGPAFLKSSIPYASEVERMGIKREPVTVYAQSSAAAQSYIALWKEIKSKLN